MLPCEKCQREFVPEKLMAIETELDRHYYCVSCINEAQKMMSMKIFLNKEERKLLKNMRKFIKHEKNN